jgi:hypothetical protein
VSIEICCTATYIHSNKEINMEKLFQIPAYSEVKTFWSNYFGNVQKFYTDFAEDVVKSFKK